MSATDKEIHSTVNPATGETLTDYRLMSADEACKIVQSSHSEYDSWSQTSLDERCEIIELIGEQLLKSQDVLCNLVVSEMGKKRSQAHDEIELCAEICKWTAANAASELADEEQEWEKGRAIISYCPQGVVLGIQPWNFPIYQAIRYSIPNLAAGNTVVLKHADNVWGCAEALGSIVEKAGLPRDAFRTLRCDHEALEQVISMPEICGVTLTGSDAAGRAIAKVAGQNLKKTVLELGSNDAYLVLDDADLELAVQTCIEGRIYNSGQTCVAAKRFVVVADLYDEFLQGLEAGMSKLTFGPPDDDDSELGPMARADLRDDLHEQVKKSVELGAKLHMGGEMPDGEGFYYPATLLTGVVPGMPAYEEELFGPVAAVIKAKDNDDAMSIANDSRFGLGGGIFSTDETAAIKLAKRDFHTGMVNINGYALSQPQLPFGGVKDSGYGREHGGFGMREFVNIKSIVVTS